jgi:hypothetical protein
MDMGFLDGAWLHDLNTRDHIDVFIPVKENMNIVIHPITLTGDAYAFCCDNYLVTGSGAVRLHKTPREIFVV